MKISELITELSKFQTQHGDLKICQLVDVVDISNSCKGDIHGGTNLVENICLKPVYIEWNKEKYGDMYNYFTQEFMDERIKKVDELAKDGDINAVDEWGEFLDRIKKICTFV